MAPQHLRAGQVVTGPVDPAVPLPLLALLPLLATEGGHDGPLLLLHPPDGLHHHGQVALLALHLLGHLPDDADQPALLRQAPAQGALLVPLTGGGGKLAGGLTVGWG